MDDLPALVLGLATAILPRLVEPGIRDLYQQPKHFALLVTAAWMLAAVAGLAVLGRPVVLPRTPLHGPLAVLALCVAWGVAIAPQETGGVLSLFAEQDAGRWAASILLALLAVVAIRTPRQLLYVVAGSLLGGTQVALFGIAQHHHIDGLLPVDARRWVDINAPGSTFGNRNMAAQLIVSVMPAAYVLLAMALRWWRRDRVQQALIWGAVGNLFLFALLYYLRLSVTRSAWGGALLGVLVAVGLWALARPPRDPAGAEEPAAPATRSATPLVLGLLATGLGAIAIASTVLMSSGFKATYDEGVGDRKRRMGIVELVSTVGDTEDAHWAMRWMMWASTWEAIKAKPLGGGAGNWRVLFPQYVVQRQANDHFSIAKQPVRAHNDFLQIGSEYGVAGLGAFLALIGVAMAMAWQTRRRASRGRLREDDDAAWLSLGALASTAGLVAICGDALLSFPFQLPAPTFFFFVHLGIIAAAWVQLRQREQRAYPEEIAPLAPPLAVRGPAVPALAAVAIIAVAGVHWHNGRQVEAEKGFTLARAKQKRGDAAGGLVEIRKAIAINPDDFQNHFIEGLCHNSLGDMQAAIVSIENSLRLYPNLLNAWVNLAMFAQKAGDEAKMQHAIDTALALKPDEVYALNTLARWRNRRGEFDMTIAALEPHLETLKDNDGVLDNLERAYTVRDRWADVAKVRAYRVANIKAAHIVDGSPGYQARRAADDRRIAEARRTGQAAIGEAWGKAGAWAKAADALRIAAELGGQGHADVKANYALALARAGDYERARGQAQVALAIDRAGQEAHLLRELGALKQERASDAAAQAGIERVLAAIRGRAAP